MYTQLFNLLCTIADDEYHGKLPVHVRCILDEFANIGQIPKFDKLIATIRSREISASIILQSKAQLKSIYKDNAETIEGNCDTFLFLGGKEKSTLKDLSEVLGKETIDTYNTSDTRGTSQSYGMVGERLVGLARVLDDSELVAFVHYVLVHPEYQGQKIAGNMVEYIRDKYKNYLYIEGMQEDSKNVAFYERHGFHVMEGGTPIQICNFSDKR